MLIHNRVLTTHHQTPNVRIEKIQISQKGKNCNFDKKIRNLFSGSRITKRISPLESSNSETVGVDTFFEASSIGCRKTIFDVTKFTYNMYSCDTCCMSREMMETDGRDSAKCQKSKLRDIDDIFGIV